MVREVVTQLRQELLLIMEGSKPKAILENLNRLLKFYQIKVRYNVIRKDLEIEIPEQEFNDENKLNASFAVLTSRCHEHKMSSADLGMFLWAIADRNFYNPVTEWIEGKEWDGESRLKEFYDTIQSENDGLKEKLLYRWLIGAVAALYEEDGVSTSGILVLQGAQYKGKTRWFKNLVHKTINKYVKDGLSVNPNDRDSKKIAVSYWLAELGELRGSLRANSQDAMKGFLTSDSDVLRLPYARAESRFPRRTVFCGTVNEREFLKDRTGNRRYYTIACEKINHSHGLNTQQIWAEIKVAYDNGEQWHLTEEEFNELNANNAKHEVINPLEEKIKDFYDWEQWRVDDPMNRFMTATQIGEEINVRGKFEGTSTRIGVTISKIIPHEARRSSNRGTLWPMPHPRLTPHKGE